jgi:hypothetical protein
VWQFAITQSLAFVKFVRTLSVISPNKEIFYFLGPLLEKIIVILPTGEKTDDLFRYWLPNRNEVTRLVVKMLHQ